MDTAAATSQESVKERIAKAYATLPEAQRQFAELTLGEPLFVARAPMQEAAGRIGVSVATANRFARMLGYAGYPEFRSALIEGFESVLGSVERMESSLHDDQGEVPSIVGSALAGIERNLEATRNSLEPAVLEQAVKMIVESRRRFVVGFERAAHLSAIFASELNMRCGNTESLANVDGAVGAAMRLHDFDERDLIIATVFPRYFRETVDIVRLAKRQGVKVLAISDSPRSPIASIADACIYVVAERTLGSSSDASVLAVMEALVAAVTVKVPDASERYRSLTQAALDWYAMPER
ncbi:MAG: MurR/RpiR family transcriptional regulator [Janthinobacterium lividum]